VAGKLHAAERGEANAVGGIDFGVPLLDLRLQLDQAGDQGLQAGRRAQPSVSASDKLRQRQRLLSVSRSFLPRDSFKIAG
jgi:hypothetical protein